MEASLEKVMMEPRCPDCNGARVRPQRLLVTVGGLNLTRRRCGRPTM